MSDVFRVIKNSNYTVMSNYHLRDKNLSLKAKGLFAIRVLEGNRVTPEETILMAEMIKTGAFNKRVMGLEKLSNAHCGDKIETQHWINPVLHP